MLAELDTNLPATRRAPQRAARLTKKNDQLLLFTDPADEVIEEIRRLDTDKMTPLEALQALARWRNRLSGQ